MLTAFDICSFPDAESDGTAQHIQNDIVDLTEASERKQLGQFHRGHNQGDCTHAPEESALPGPEGGEQKTQGDEHEDIPAQIVDHHPQHIKPQIFHQCADHGTDGGQGDQIDPTG